MARKKFTYWAVWRRSTGIRTYDTMAYTFVRFNVGEEEFLLLYEDRDGVGGNAIFSDRKRATELAAQMNKSYREPHNSYHVVGFTFEE